MLLSKLKICNLFYAWLNEADITANTVRMTKVRADTRAGYSRQVLVRADLM